MWVNYKISSALEQSTDLLSEHVFGCSFVAKFEFNLKWDSHLQKKLLLFAWMRAL